MPIRPEMQWRYPPNWPEISAKIRDRAWNKCEACGVENYALGGRADDGRFLAALPTGENSHGLQWPRPGEYGSCVRQGTARPIYWCRIIRIVLTVAHLNHKPEDCRPENLRCWCQRCHNRYDAKERRRGMQERARAAVGDLFACEAAP